MRILRTYPIALIAAVLCLSATATYGQSTGQDSSTAPATSGGLMAPGGSTAWNPTLDTAQLFANSALAAPVAVDY